MEYYQLTIPIPKQPLQLLKFRISTILLLTAILALALAWRRDHKKLAAQLYPEQNLSGELGHKTSNRSARYSGDRRYPHRLGLGNARRFEGMARTRIRPIGRADRDPRSRNVQSGGARQSHARFLLGQ